jgi:hypothetical protein
VVERLLPKQDIVGSNPITRSQPSFVGWNGGFIFCQAMNGTIDTFK